MPSTSPATSVPGLPTYPSVPDVEVPALASLQSSRSVLSGRPSLLMPKVTRKPVPPIVPNPVAFPAYNNSHHENSTPPSSQHQPGSPVPSSTPSPYKRAMSSPSPSPPPQRLVPRPSLVSAAHPTTAGPALSTSVSLARNSSIPASLSHNYLSSNLPARASSVSHNRPSLSSPSPPTPIVPSIPLRHATQYSPRPAHTTPVPTTPRSYLHANTTHSRGSLDRHSLFKQPPPEHSPELSSSTNVSDPNLPFRISASAIPIEQPSCYVLPLKQLLAKPAIPTQFQSGSGSGGEFDGGDQGPLLKPCLYAAHKRSASANDSVVPFIAPCRNSDMSVIESSVTRSPQPRFPVTSPISLTARGGPENEGYHYWRTGEDVLKGSDVGKQKRKVGIGVMEDSFLWPDWTLGVVEECEQERNKVSDPPRSRNVLKRRPSKSARPSDTVPPNRQFQSHPSETRSPLSRSLSTSSLLKRVRLLTSPSPNIRSPSLSPPKSSVSDVSGRSVSQVDMYQINNRVPNNRISIQHQGPDSNQPMHTVTVQDSGLGIGAKMVIPTAGGSSVSVSASASPVVARQSSATLSSSGTPERPLTNLATATTLSTGLPESSLGNAPRQSRDNSSEHLSQASALADAYRREQRAKEAEEATATPSLVSIAPLGPPTGPPLPLWPNSPLTATGSPHLFPPSNPDPLRTTNIYAITAAASSSKNSSSSSSKGGRGSALSYAEILNNKADVAEKTGTPTGETNLVGPADTSQQHQQQQYTRASLSEAVKISVTKEKEDPISDSVHELPLMQSPPPPPPPPLPLLPVKSLPAPSSSSNMPSPPPVYHQVHHSLSSSHLASPPWSPLPASQRAGVKSNKLKKARHASDQSELSYAPYYTIVGTRSDQVFGVGGRRDSFGAGYSEVEKASWDIRTTITAGAAATSERGDKDKDKMSIGRSLSRKLSGKFKREKSPDDITMSRGRTATGQDARTHSASRSGPPTTANSPRGLYISDQAVEDDRCFPSVYSARKQAQSEMDLSARAKEKEREKDSDRERDNGGSRMLPKLWRLLGGRSKSRERSEIEGGHKTDKPPPLPALPKYYVSALNDIHTPIYSEQQEQQEHKSNSLPRTSHKSPRSRSVKSSPATPTGRPSTATTPTRSSTSDAPPPSPFWNRSHSAGSSVTSLGEVPPLPSPLPDLRRYTTDETDPRSRSRAWRNTNVVTTATRSPRTIQSNTEEEPPKPPHANANANVDIGRSDSPPIPLFSTAEPINSFPVRRSSERPKTSPASSTVGSSAPCAASAPINPSFNPPPPRPARSAQRPIFVHSRTNSFSDEALYPPVMKTSDSNTRSIPKMTFREMDSSNSANRRRQVLTEQEKADRWDALLERSEAAGGTLHFGGEEDKLPSDELRFSRTLSELARDDDESESVSTI